MKEFTDVTSTTFGLIIAYVVPGVLGLFGISFFSPRLDALFKTIISGESTAAVFLVMLLAAIAAGLQLSVARSLVFESLLGKFCEFIPGQLAKLMQEGKLPAARLLIDEQYRYHQFWGAMCFVQPILFYDWVASLHGHEAESGCWGVGFSAAVGISIAVECATIYAGMESLKSATIERSRKSGEIIYAKRYAAQEEGG